MIAGAAFIIGVAGIFVIPKNPSKKVGSPDEPRASGVDWIGVFLFTIGALLLLVALSEGVSLGWKTPFVIAILIVSVFLLVTFGFWQNYLEGQGKEPLMRVSTFNNSRFSCAMAVVFVFSAAFTNFLVYSTY